MQLELSFDDRTDATALPMSDLDKIIHNKQRFVEEMTREVNRVERLKWASYRKNRRRSSSVARVNQAKLAAAFDISGEGYSDLDMITGEITLSLPMVHKANYYDDVLRTVEAYISRKSS